MDFLLATDIVIMSVGGGRRNSQLNVGSTSQERPRINIPKVLSFEDIKLMICGQKNVYEGLIQDTVRTLNSLL